ncbi:hypothetical protein [Arvimicrobium flavum]|uniref:hypothetical protein n=1 Tax=Arvimicrobium flavum TaxID=3393320 RepID=UPI00237BC1ED|nr:hypothetical protein [Mesorhizobium shangrilense]
MDVKTKFNLVSIGLMVGIVAAVWNPLWVDPQGTIDTATQHGLTDVQPRGYSWFGCNAGDMWRTKFTAKTEQGKEVSGTMCRTFHLPPSLRLDPTPAR